MQVLLKDLAEDQAAHLARVGELFNKPQFSDVRVVAADGCGFYCHRAILASCSKPFERAMLTEGDCMSMLPAVLWVSAIISDSSLLPQTCSIYRALSK